MGVAELLLAQQFWVASPYSLLDMLREQVLCGKQPLTPEASWCNMRTFFTDMNLVSTIACASPLAYFLWIDADPGTALHCCCMPQAMDISSVDSEKLKFADLIKSALINCGINPEISGHRGGEGGNGCLF
jgi:hypothetical protein